MKYTYIYPTVKILAVKVRYQILEGSIKGIDTDDDDPIEDDEPEVLGDASRQYWDCYWD